jgi:hypothetical protein
MVKALTNAKNYNWSEWWLGIMRSFLSGGAAAFLTFGGGSLVGVPAKQVWQMVGINFIAMGMYRMGEFLQLHGAPEAATIAPEAARTDIPAPNPAAATDQAATQKKDTQGD